MLSGCKVLTKQTLITLNMYLIVFLLVLVF